MLDASDERGDLLVAAGEQEDLRLRFAHASGCAKTSCFWQGCQKLMVLAHLFCDLEPVSLYEVVDGFLAHTNYLRKLF